MATVAISRAKVDKLPVLLGAFFLSGFSALLYQVVWRRGRSWLREELWPSGYPSPEPKLS